MGGDEFCVLIERRRRERAASLSSVQQLTRGAGLHRSPPPRRGQFPAEAGDADRRSCRSPTSACTSARRRRAQQRRQQLQDVLLQAFNERYPELRSINAVSASSCWRSPPDRHRRRELDGSPARRAARRRQDRDPRRDPRTSPARRHARSGGFMRRHTILGERIVAAAALRAGRPSSCAPPTSARTAAATRTGSPPSDPARRADHLRLRRLRRDDLRPHLQPCRHTAASARRAARLRRHAVRPRRCRCLRPRPPRQGRTGTRPFGELDPDGLGAVALGSAGFERVTGNRRLRRHGMVR